MILLPHFAALSHPSFFKKARIHLRLIVFFACFQQVELRTFQSHMLFKSTKVLIFYCCITNYLKSYWLKTTNIYYLAIFVGQEFRSNLGGCLLSQSLLQGYVVGVGWATVSSESYPGEDPLTFVRELHSSLCPWNFPLSMQMLSFSQKMQNIF